MTTERSKRYNRKNPSLNKMPRDVIMHILSFLPNEGVQPAQGTITSNYKNLGNYGPVYANNNPRGNHGVQFELKNSRKYPLTDKTKQIFAHIQNTRGHNIARVFKRNAPEQILYEIYGSSHPINVTNKYVDGGSPIYPSSNNNNNNNNNKNRNAIGGHMYLNAKFRVGKSGSPSKRGGTKNSVMRTSKTLRDSVKQMRTNKTLRDSVKQMSTNKTRKGSASRT